jgi:hypothetical protein
MDSLFKNISKEHIFYAVFGIVVALVIYKERQALGCPNIPNGTDCANGEGKAVKGTKPSLNDDVTTLISKIIKAADFADRWVTWRLSFLLSIPCIFIIYFFLHQRRPDIKELSIGIFVITSIV